MLAFPILIDLKLICITFEYSVQSISLLKGHCSPECFHYLVFPLFSIFCRNTYITFDFPVCFHHISPKLHYNHINHPKRPQFSRVLPLFCVSPFGAFCRNTHLYHIWPPCALPSVFSPGYIIITQIPISISHMELFGVHI